MHDTLLQDVRGRVTAQEAARFYGLDLDRKGWARCPFHRDTHASMSFKGARWRCWVCNMGGDAIDLVARMYDLPPRSAASKLNEDLHLGLAVDRAMTAQERDAARHREALRRAKEEFEAWRVETTRRLDAVADMGRDALDMVERPEQWDLLTPQQQAAARCRDTAEYWGDILAWGDPRDQAELYARRKEIQAWTNRILTPS